MMNNRERMQEVVSFLKERKIPFQIDFSARNLNIAIPDYHSQTCLTLVFGSDDCPAGLITVLHRCYTGDKHDDKYKLKIDRAMVYTVDEMYNHIEAFYLENDCL